MASYLKASIQRSYAESFLAELERNENQYFFFIAKSTPWTNENSPPTYSDTVRGEYDVMNNIIGYKKLNPQNILFALPRYDWKANTVYDSYDDNINLFDDTDPAIFFVVTDENNVYKCISNGGNTNRSTVKPTGTLTQSFSTSDGYTWKYLSTIRESDLPYELQGYVPVDFATTSTDTDTVNQYRSQIDAVPSSIDRIVVTNSSPVGIYPKTISTTDYSGFVLRVARVDEISENTTSKIVVITDDISKSRLGNPSEYSNYVGYAMRVDSNTTVDPSQRGNYGIITAVQSSGNEVRFTVKDDVLVFDVSTTGVGIASVEILPYIKINGNGSGACAFPVMSSTKTITAIQMGRGGRGYSNVSASVSTTQQAGTNSPTLRAVISPKGGHGSNILKELNIKDLLIIIQISEEDSAKIIGGGSYRQFGIIKNPVLNDGSGEVAGLGDLYYRDISLVAAVRGLGDSSDFSGEEANIILGTESYSSAKVVQVKSVNFENSESIEQIVVKTQNPSGKFISRQDRQNDYILSFESPSVAGFIPLEPVTQTIPAGTVFGAGISFDYNFTVSGKVLSVLGSDVVVRLVSEVNFLPGFSLSGTISRISPIIQDVVPRQGEYVWVTKTAPNGLAVFTDSGSGVQKKYKVFEIGNPYFNLDSAPSYSGLHVLELSSSVSTQTGAMDTTGAPLTQNSFVSGDTVTQGSAASPEKNASGTVYYWDFINSARGNLYLTSVSGTFNSVDMSGISGSTLGSFIVSKVTLPDIDPTSGEVLYIDNVRPIQRNMGQKEEFRLRLGF